VANVSMKPLDKSFPVLIKHLYKSVEHIYIHIYTNIHIYTYAHTFDIMTTSAQRAAAVKTHRLLTSDVIGHNLRKVTSTYPIWFMAEIWPFLLFLWFGHKPSWSLFYVGWLIGQSQHKFQNKQIVVRQGPGLNWNWPNGTGLGNNRQNLIVVINITWSHKHVRDFPIK